MGHVQRINPNGTRCSTRTHLMGHVHAKDQTNPMGIRCKYKGPILWWHDACYKEPILWGHDACTEDQSYGTVHVATRTNVQTQVALYHVLGRII